MDDSSARRSKILLIEDSAGDVELLRLALDDARVEYELKLFKHGGEALAYIKERGVDESGGAPDLAIIDLNLPQNGGLEILEAMRNSITFAQVPVAVFSSSSLPRERARLEALHVVRFITKPTDLDEMLQVGILLKQLLAEFHHE